MSIIYTDVSSLAIGLGKVPVQVRAAVRPAVNQAAELIAAQARANASWSSRIPGAISTSVRFSSRGGAVVRVSSAAAPHARPYEGIGNPGSTFRHPVYGNDWWVEQAERPFLIPARQAKGEAAKALIFAAVKSATRI